METFVGSFISAYTTAIHKAVILNFGYNGAVEGYRSSLLFYVISTGVYAMLEPFAVAPLISYQLPSKPEAIIPILMLSFGIIFKLLGVISGYILHSNLPVVTQQVEEGNEHFLSRTYALPWFIKGWTLAFAGCILLEAIILVFAQLDFMKGQLHVASMALNMGLHSAFLFTLCTYQNKNFTSLRMTRRFYIAAFTIFGAISLVEFINGLLALAFYDAQTWQMGIWIFIIFIRTFIEAGTVFAFSTIEQRIPKPHMEKDEKEEREEERENSEKGNNSNNNNNNSNNNYNNNGDNEVGVLVQDHLVKRRAESGAKYESGEIENEENQNNSVNEPFLMEGNKVEEVPLSPKIIYSGTVAKRWSFAFGISIFALCIFMLFTEVMDYSGMLVSFSSISEMGGHTAPYECVYHFIILVTAFSVFGVLTRNSGFLHVASMIFTNLAVLAFLEIFVLALNYHTNINNIVAPSSSYQNLSILIMTWFFITSCGAGYYLQSHSSLLISSNIQPEVTVW